jgi:primary-amine oxidase
MSITDIQTSVAYSAPDAPAHPLSSLSVAELEAVRTIVLGRADFTTTTRFAYVGLEEPTKGEVLGWEAGEAPLPDRRARVQLLDMATGRSTDSIVSITTGETLSSTVLDGSKGQLPILDAEFEDVGLILAEDEGWIAALAARGLTIDQVVAVPLSAGHYGYAAEEGRRVVRSFVFRMDHPADHPWAYPVDGLTAYIDTADRRVIEIIDTPGFAVPSRTATSTTLSCRGRHSTPSSRSSSRSPRDRASRSTANTSPGATGSCGSASTCARA